MSTSELKIDLINQITNMTDQVRLKELLQLLKLQNENSIYLTDDDEKDAVLEARKEIAEGKVFSNKEVQKEINEWLNK